jgi:hypothetical protein
MVPIAFFCGFIYQVQVAHDKQNGRATFYKKKKGRATNLLKSKNQPDTS